MGAVTDETCRHGVVAGACVACTAASAYRTYGVTSLAENEAKARRERQRLAWTQFMAALLADGLDPVQGAPQADEAMEQYNERWEQDAP